MSSLVRRALPVAGLAALIAAITFVFACLGVDLFVSGRLTADVDQRISERLETLRQPGTVFPVTPVEDEADRNFEAPLVIWRLNADGQVIQSTPNSPSYPNGLRVTGPTTVRIAGTDFRLNAASPSGATIIVGESLASVESTSGTLLLAEAIVGPLLVALVFLGTLGVGLRVAGPIERVRRQQLAFTADASHELRTPLSVIEAETSLALRRERDATGYRGALERVSQETTRLRRIVEDLLLLARADALPPAPAEDTADLVTAAESAVERFRAVASERQLRLTVDSAAGAATVAVPAEWLDRLLGILLDNACRYSPPGGSVVVWVQGSRHRWQLGVDDTGPGIPANERRRIFDRFHRATPVPGGAGLGLAIADAIVRASRGRWELDQAPIGGARMAVSWARALPLPSAHS